MLKLYIEYQLINGQWPIGSWTSTNISILSSQLLKKTRDITKILIHVQWTTDSYIHFIHFQGNQQQFPSAWAWSNRSTTLRMSAVQVFPWWHSAPAFHAVFNWWAMATLATFSGLIRMDDVVIPETLRGPDFQNTHAITCRNSTFSILFLSLSGF